MRWASAGSRPGRRPFAPVQTPAPEFGGPGSSASSTPEVGLPQLHMPRHTRVQLRGLLKQLSGLDIGLFRERVNVLHPAQVGVIGFQVVGSLRTSYPLSRKVSWSFSVVTIFCTISSCRAKMSFSGRS